MHQKPRIPPRPKEDGVSCCMMDEIFDYLWNGSKVSLGE
jgi:hypothetical protein